MNLFNRIVIILLILAAMLIIPLLLVFPEQAEFALRYAADVIQANLAWLNKLSPTAQIGVRMLLGGVGMVVFVIGLLFLALEVIRIRRKTVRLRDGSGELMMDGISGHLAYYIDLLPDVIRVRPKVTSKGKTIEVETYVETAPGVNIPAKTAEIKETAQHVIEDELGLQLKGEVKVRIKPVYPKHDRQRKKVTAPQPPSVTPPLVAAEPSPSEDDAIEEFVLPMELPEKEDVASETIEVKAPPTDEDE
jgi:hypothetical protein